MLNTIKMWKTKATKKNSYYVFERGWENCGYWYIDGDESCDKDAVKFYGGNPKRWGWSVWSRSELLNRCSQGNCYVSDIAPVLYESPICPKR